MEPAVGVSISGNATLKSALSGYISADQAVKYYYAGQVPPQNIFNPAAWGEFIKAWKRGDFKKKK